jgi:hypothetical protein
MSSNFLVNVYGTNTDVLSLINTKTVTTVEISTQNPTNQKYNVTFNRQVAIRTGDITVGINGYCLNGAQVYTFGPAQPPLLLGGGQGANTLAFSTNILNWNGLTNTSFSTYGNTICYNGKIWVAGGSGTNTLAYSWDGKYWFGLGSSILSSSCNYIAWNGSLFVAGGSGTNGLAYSYDGINWIGLGTSTISNGQIITWNGYQWLAGGQGTNKIAYSTNGISWTNSTSGSQLFTTVLGITWNGTTWLADGSGTTVLAYSIDGISWNSINYTLLNTGTTLAWNGTIWSMGGLGGNTITYTTDSTGQTGWIGIGNVHFSTQTNLIKWNGKYFIGSGIGANTISYSLNGINWIGLGSGIYSSAGTAIEFNSLRPHSITIPRYMVIAGGGSTISANCITYSYNGVSWSNVNTSIFNNYCLCIQYNGKIWIAGGGSSGNTLAYS